MENVEKKKITKKELIDFYNKMKSNVIEQVGYIWLPSIDGFKIFEIPAERLDLYLKAESMHNQLSINEIKESS